MPARTFATRVTALLLIALAGSSLAADKKPSKARAAARARAAAARAAAAAKANPSKTPGPEEVPTPEPPDEPPSSAPDSPTQPPESGFAQKAPGGGITAKVSLESSGYGDTDHVYVGSPSVGGSIADEVAGWSLGVHYLVDVVSAASVDIVSTASRHWVEVRHAGSADGSMKLDDVTFGVSGSVSREPDYLSITGGGTLTVDLLDKNVTPFAAFSYGRDQVGRTGLPHEFWQEKQTTSGKLGVTFVVDRSTIASVQADAIEETGYLAKPYRYLPLFAPGQGATVGPGASIAEVNAVRLDQRVAEQVPNRRHRFALSGRLAHRFTSSTLRLEERAYTDSWGLSASTSDFRFIVDAGRRLTLWPHLRFHIQNQVAFWQRAYEALPGPNGSLGLPVLRVGDRELSRMYMGVAGGGVKLNLASDPRKSWALIFEFDASLTHYFDTLYISERRAIFSTLAVEAEF